MAEAEAAGAREVRQVLIELELVKQLDEARLVKSQMHEGSSGYDHAASDRAYAQAFANAGLDIENATVEAAIAQLQSHPRILPEVAKGLTDWSISRWSAQKKELAARVVGSQRDRSRSWRNRLRLLWSRGWTVAACH